MKIKLGLSFIVFLFAIPICFAQGDFRNGYIITLEKDTIQGQLEYRSNARNYESCLFKSSEGEVEYHSEQILGFRYENDKFFSSRIVMGTFVEVLVLGDISLYKADSKFIVEKDSAYYDLQSEVQMVEIDGIKGAKDVSKWRGILTYLISDCLKNPGAIVENTRLEEMSLIRLIVKYNKCQGNSYTDFQASQPWFSYWYGATAGINRSEIVSEVLPEVIYLDESYTSIDPFFGVVGEVFSPRFIENMSLQGELHFLRSTYSSLKEVSVPPGIHDTFITLNTISLPLSLKYYIKGEKYRLYIQGGINFDFQVSSRARVRSEFFRRNVVSTAPEGRAFNIGSSQVGLWGGVGVMRAYSDFKGELAVRFYNMSDLNATGNFTSNINRISLNLILFKK